MRTRQGCWSMRANGAAMLTAQLAAEVSHDMRVPLTSIIAHLEMLEEELGDNPDPAIAAVLARTRRAADRMERMLDQRMGAGPVAVGRTLVAVDLCRVAHQVAVDSCPAPGAGRCQTPDRMAAARARGSGRDVFRVAEPAHQRREIREARSSSAGVHLVQTGVCSGGGSPWLTTASASRRTVVSDVFTMFTQADARVEGHGIGLGTVARIVSALDGRVGADEAPSGGAEVWFELPASCDA